MFTIGLIISALTVGIRTNYSWPSNSNRTAALFRLTKQLSEIAGLGISGSHGGAATE